MRKKTAHPTRTKCFLNEFIVNFAGNYKPGNDTHPIVEPVASASKTKRWMLFTIRVNSNCRVGPQRRGKIPGWRRPRRWYEQIKEERRFLAGQSRGWSRRRRKCRWSIGADRCDRYSP